MLERLRRFREPAAYVVLAAIGLQIVLALVAVGYYTVLAGPSGAGYIAAEQLSRTLMLLAVIVVASCALWGPPTPHARTIALAGIVLFGVHGGLALVLAVIGMFESGNAFAMVTVLLELLVPGLAIVVLIAVRSGLPPARPASGHQLQGQQLPGQQQPRQPYPGQPHGRPQNLPTRPVQQPPGGRPPQQPGEFPPGTAPNVGQDRPSDRASFPSQKDQFGNPHANSARRYGANSGPQRQSLGETDQWQPVDQPGPQRLEPSPYHSPVGPHTRTDGSEAAENGDPDPGRRG